MLRRALIGFCAAAICFCSGCTASDREYMRNHVVETSSKTPLVISSERTVASDQQR